MVFSITLPLVTASLSLGLYAYIIRHAPASVDDEQLERGKFRRHYQDIVGAGGKGQAAWKRLDTLTAIAEDPDTFQPDPASLQHAKVLRPGQPKKRITPLGCPNI